VIEEEIPWTPRSAPAAAALPRAETIAPVLRTVAATSMEGDARAVERRPAASPRAGAPAKARGGASPGRKSTSWRGPSGSSARLEPGPREACGDRSFFGMAICINRQCQSTRFRQHPQCVELQRQWQERRMRVEHP
jgi:hypothetical protein